MLDVLVIGVDEKKLAVLFPNLGMKIKQLLLEKQEKTMYKL